MEVTLNEVNSLLNSLDIMLDYDNKELLLNYSKKRGLNIDELRSDISKTGIEKLLNVRAPRFLYSSALSFHEFLLILKRNGFSLTLDHAEIREMYEIFMSMHKENVRNMDRATVGMIFKGAKKYMIANTDKFVDFSKVKDLIKTHQSETDLKLYQAFYKIDQKFKETNLLGEKTPVDTLIKKCYKKAQQVCAELNVEEDALTDDVINIIWSLACIYNSLVNYTSDLSVSSTSRLSAYAEKLLQERILSKSTLFYKDLMNYYPDTKFESTQMYYFDEFLNSLMNNPDADKTELFNERDVYELINHTPYLVFVANKEKLEGARIALNYYMEAVLKDFPKIKRKTTKDMFKKAGSILNNSPIANENAVHLLLGEDVGSILKLNFGKDHYLSRKKTLKQEYMKMSFGNMRISGMDFNKHSFVLNNRNSIFTTLTIDNMYDCIANVLNLTCDALDINEQYLATKKIALDRRGFNVSEMFTGDNIFDIFDISSKFIAQTNTKREDLENYKQNIKILSALISMPNALKVVQHNFKFLTQDNTAEFTKIIQASKTQEELKANLTRLINSKIKTSGKAAGSIAEGEGKFTKLQKTKIELDRLDIDPEQLKKLGLECQFELPKEKAKTHSEKKLKLNTGLTDLVGDLNKLENDIQNTDEDVMLPLYQEDDVDEEDVLETQVTSPYDDWAKLQFEMGAIAEYFSKLKPLDTSKPGWYKKGNRTNTHAEDSSWLENFPTYKDTIIYDLVGRNTSQFISPFMSNKASVRAINKQLNELFAKILLVKNEIYIDKSSIDDTIEYLNSIIAAKQADKRTLMDEVLLSATSTPNREEQPKYIQILMERARGLGKSAKRNKFTGLVKASAEQMAELKKSKLASKSSTSAYNVHIESKHSATASIAEYERLCKLVDALETIKDSFETFKKEINKVDVVAESETQMDDATMQRIEELEQEIYSLKQSIAKRENYIKGLQGAQKSGTKDHVLKVQRQLDAQYKKLKELESELQSLNGSSLPSQRSE